ncbi:MAG: Flp family type IVb pilin [Aeromicrobium sp.]
MNSFRNKCARERGATGVEYALIIGFVSLAIVAAAVSLGGGFNVWAGTVVDTVADLLN